MTHVDMIEELGRYVSDPELAGMGWSFWLELIAWDMALEG